MNDGVDEGVREDARWSLKDEFENWPGGYAGKVRVGIWGTSYGEFGEIAAREALDRQNASPDKLVRKIGPQRISRKRNGRK